MKALADRCHQRVADLEAQFVALEQTLIELKSIEKQALDRIKGTTGER